MFFMFGNIATNDIKKHLMIHVMTDIKVKKKKSRRMKVLIFPILIFGNSQ